MIGCRTAAELSELSIAIEEAERSAELEQSLVGAEVEGKQLEAAQLDQLLRELRDKEAQLAGQLGERRGRHGEEMARARARLEEAEAALEELEGRQTGDLDTDQETELLENIKRSHELLEAERRVFEDLEFRQMEEEASLEAEMEDVSRVINETQGSLEAAEVTVGEMERSRLEMSHSGELESMQGRREEVTRKLEREKEKLADLETRLRQLLVGSRSERSSEDSGTITWAEAEPEAAGLTGSWAENNITKSLGSSTSDLTATPSPHSSHRGRGGVAAMAGDTPQQRAGIPTPKAVSATPPGWGGLMEESLVMSDCSLASRPASCVSRPGSVTDTASSWVGGVVLRGGGTDGGRSSRLGPAAQRPLTRYLPVSSQQDFDLRRHIETAGHQVRHTK